MVGIVLDKDAMNRERICGSREDVCMEISIIGPTYHAVPNGSFPPIIPSLACTLVDWCVTDIGYSSAELSSLDLVR